MGERWPLEGRWGSDGGGAQGSFRYIGDILVLVFTASSRAFAWLVYLKIHTYAYNICYTGPASVSNDWMK